MFKNNNLNNGNGLFSASNNSPNRDNGSVLNADGISHIGGGFKAGSVSGNQMFKYPTDEVIEGIKIYATITISDSSTLKSAITVSTAQVSGTSLVHKGEEGENNSLLFYQDIGTLARNVAFGGLLEDQVQLNGSLTILSAIMEGHVDLHGAILVINKNIRKSLEVIESLEETTIIKERYQ